MLAGTRPRGDTSKYAGFVLRIMRAYGRRVADADEADIVEMLETLQYAESIAAQAIADYIARDADRPARDRTRTYRSLARALHVSESAFREKWKARIARLL